MGRASAQKALSQKAEVVAAFLRDVLARDALAVPELEEMARAAGHLGERQRLSQSKAFRSAKKSLEIRSTRDGFGPGKWLWQLPGHGVSASLSQAGQLPAKSKHEAPAKPRIPPEWTEGIASLEYQSPPPDVPAHRWHQFVDDCTKFVSSSENWAERAAALGWDTVALFGCRRSRPLLHLGDAGLLWAINGGRLVEVHRHWATFELAFNGSRRTYDRRRVDPAKVILPWTGRSKPQVSP